LHNLLWCPPSIGYGKPARTCAGCAPRPCCARGGPCQLVEHMSKTNGLRMLQRNCLLHAVGALQRTGTGSRQRSGEKASHAKFFWVSPLSLSRSICASPPRHLVILEQPTPLDFLWPTVKLRIESHIGDTGPVRRGEARPHRFLDKHCAASAARRSAAILAQHEVRSHSRHVRVTGACTMGRTLPLRHGKIPSKPAPCILGALGAAAGAHSLVYPATAAQALYGAVGAT